MYVAYVRKISDNRNERLKQAIEAYKSGNIKRSSYLIWLYKFIQILFALKFYKTIEFDLVIQ